MAILWADNFQAYAGDETAMSDGLYVEVPTTTYFTLVTDPDPNADAGSYAGRFGTSASGTADCLVRYALPQGAVAEIGSALRVWCEDLPTQDGKALEIFSWRDIDNVVHAVLEITTTGALRLRRGGEGGTILGTSTLPLITAQAWHHVEARIVIDDTVGEFELYVNGDAVAGMNLTGLDTRNGGISTCAQIAILQRATSGGSRQAYHFKDFLVWDTTGSVNNTFIGLCEILYLPLDGDSSLNWTPSTGATGYDLLNEAPPDDADYISAASAAVSPAEFTFQNLPTDVTSVKALLSVGRLQKTDAGAATVQMGLKVSGSTDLGADRNITEAYTYWFDVSEISPATAIPWNPTEVNNATIQIDRTT
jgi:hypothetical protein